MTLDTMAETTEPAPRAPYLMPAPPAGIPDRQAWAVVRAYRLALEAGDVLRDPARYELKTAETVVGGALVFVYVEAGMVGENNAQAVFCRRRFNLSIGRAGGIVQLNAKSTRTGKRVKHRVGRAGGYLSVYTTY